MKSELKEGLPVLVNLLWHERGFLRQVFWSTALTAPAMAVETARRLVKEARANAGVMGLRVHIAPAI